MAGASELPPRLALRRLELGDNRVGDAGAASLAEALHWDARLQHLDLAHNGIGIDGARALHQALGVNGVLCSLGLHGVRLGGSGGSAGDSRGSAGSAAAEVVLARIERALARNLRWRKSHEAKEAVALFHGVTSRALRRIEQLEQLLAAATDATVAQPATGDTDEL